MFYVSVCLPMLVWLIGIIIAIVKWREAPRNSMFAVGGLVSILLMELSIQVKVALLKASPADIDSKLFVYLIQGLNLGELGFEVLGWMLILLAIFSGRKGIKSESG